MVKSLVLTISSKAEFIDTQQVQRPFQRFSLIGILEVAIVRTHQTIRRNCRKDKSKITSWVVILRRNFSG